MSANEDFFNKIYTKYYINVYRKIKNTLYSEIDDDITSCVQETYIKVLANIETLKKHKNVAGWLVVTAKNVARDFNKQYLIRQNFIADYNGVEDVIDYEDFTDNIAGEIEAEKILKCLPLSERKLYEMKYVIGLSNEDIGKILRITANAVALRNKRLIQRVREFLVLKK